MLFNMDQPGVTVKPIRLISGSSPFCETFFDDAIAEKGNVVHRVNQGWTVAKRLLQHERSGIHTMAAAATATKRAQTGMTLPEAAKHYLADDSGSISDATLRDEITQHGMNERSLSLTQRRTVEESEGGTPGAATSIFKFYGAEVRKTQLELQLKVRGTQSLGWEGDDLFTQEERELTRNWLGSKAGSIAGGSNEVQLNILAKRVLSLPD